MNRPPRFRGVKIAAALALLAVLALMAVRHPRFKSWRATQLAAQALSALEKGDGAVAQNKVIAAFQLAPRNLTVLRAAARITAAQGDPQALIFYQSLADTGTANGEDRLGFASAALDAGIFDLFEENIGAAISRLPEGDLRVERLLGRYALMNGDFDAAVTAFRQISAANPGSAVAKLDLAGALLATPQISAQRTALPIVEEVVRMQPDLTARAMMMLASAAGLPKETRLEALDRLLKLGNLDFALRLRARRLEIAIEPARREAVVNDVVQHADLQDPERRAAIARWLVQIGANQRALELLPIETAGARMDWFLVWLDAMAGLGRWSEVQATLERPGVALPPSVRDLFYGRALAAQGKPSSALYYEKAIASAGNDLDRLLYLAGYFNEIGQPKLAERALNRLAEDPATARTAYQALIGIHRRQHDTAALLDVLGRMGRRWPSDPVIANDLRYLRLLTGQSVAQATEASRVAAGKHPGVLPFQITYALALLRQGRSAEAMALFEGSNLQLAQLLPQQKAVFAAILAANGDPGAARGVVELIDRDFLLPEELGLLVEAESR